MNSHVSRAGGAQNNTSVERKGDREVVVTRTFNAPPSAVHKAWSQPELFQRRRFRHHGLHGKYLEVVPDKRIVWTNDEGEAGAITTVTFENMGGHTRVEFHEVYPSKAALEEALQGSAAGLPEQMEQLDELLSRLCA